MQNHDTIYIIGAGAIGKSLAVFLKLQHKKVVIIRGSVDDHADFVENIQVDIIGKGTVEAQVKVTTLSNIDTLDGIIVLANKSFANHQLAKSLSAKCKNAALVILQNGLDVEQPFIESGFSQVYRVVIFASSQSVAKNKFRFKPVEPSPLGIIKGNAQTQEMIVRELSSLNFEFISVQNILPLVWTKTIANCVFNSVCPLLETDNGIFYRDENALDIARQVIAECVYVANRSGIPIEFEKVAAKLLLISKSGQGQLISTYQDILNKRETEIDSFNFAIVEKARALNCEHQVIRTKLLGELAKLKSKITMGNQSPAFRT